MFVEFDWMGAMTDSPILMVLVVCSVVTLGIALERLYYFRKRAGNADLVLMETLEALRKGQVGQALARCKATNHPVGAVGAETMECLLARPAETEEAMQVVLSQQKLLLERNTNILGTMAAVAPLIGLLGTVWGIMRAFNSMAMTGSAAPSVVAAGVAEALVTTAAGLVIAVPSVLLFNHFTKRLTTMLTVAENHARSMRIALTETTEAHQAQAGSPVQESAARRPDQLETAHRATVGSLAG
jgi:biopolymer transport protein ExbB